VTGVQTCALPIFLITEKEFTILANILNEDGKSGFVEWANINKKTRMKLKDSNFNPGISLKKIRDQF